VKSLESAFTALIKDVMRNLGYYQLSHKKGVFGGTVLGVKLRALCLLGSHFTTWAVPPTLFVLVILEIQFHFMPRPAWTEILLSVLPCGAGVTGVHHHTQPLVEMGSGRLFA
jgi:ABC-type microcin C transport system permease subunit YejE